MTGQNPAKSKRPLARRALNRALERAAPRINRVGSGILGGRVGRATVNSICEHGGPPAGALLTRLLSEPKTEKPFTWRTRLAGRTLQLPVVPSLPRSWSTALYWRWPPALPVRAFFEWYLRNTEPGLLLDVGANDGLYTYPFAAFGWRAVAFEPQPSCVDYVRLACALNGFSGVEVVQCVVDDQEADAIDFFVSESSWVSSLFRDHVESFEPAHRIAAPAVTIDRYCEEHGLSPTYLKIDVEGAEARVLRGSRTTLEQEQPDLYIEVDAAEENKRSVWEMLRPLGYAFFLITPDRSSPLRAIPDLPEFLAAGHEADHVDIVALASSSAARELAAHFDVN